MVELVHELQLDMVSQPFPRLTGVSFIVYRFWSVFLLLYR